MSIAKDRIWATLMAHGLVEGTPPAVSDDRSPWFVRVLMAIGGWLGAVFLIGFVAAGFHFVLESATASFVTGVVLGVCAAFLFALRGEGDFSIHFGFAVSLVGQILMAWGTARAFEGHDVIAAMGIAVQQAVLFLAIAHPLHRVWSAATCALALCYALGEQGLAPYAPFLLTAGTAWIWLREFDPGGTHSARRAAGYGLAAVAVIVTSAGRTSPLEWFLAHRGVAIFGGSTSEWLGMALGGLVLLWACLELIKREGIAPASPAGRTALAVAAILGLAAVKAPGLAPAMTILVLGFANGNRILAACGGVALVGYLSHYYYSLEASLLDKSALLAAAGIGLLLARLALQRLWPETAKEVSHA
jgi:hypothetical protein